jgi:hypothetical protein
MPGPRSRGTGQRHPGACERAGWPGSHAHSLPQPLGSGSVAVPPRGRGPHRPRREPCRGARGPCTSAGAPHQIAPKGLAASAVREVTHAEVLRARPDDGAVVHAHPPDVVLCSVAGLELLPIDGAFGIPAMRLAERGIPVFDYYGLVKSRARAEELVQAMSKARGSGAAWPRAHHGGVHDRRCRHHRVYANLDSERQVGYHGRNLFLLRANVHNAGHNRYHRREEPALP